MAEDPAAYALAISELETSKPPTHWRTPDQSGKTRHQQQKPSALAQLPVPGIDFKIVRPKFSKFARNYTFIHRGQLGLQGFTCLPHHRTENPIYLRTGLLPSKLCNNPLPAGLREPPAKLLIGHQSVQGFNYRVHQPPVKRHQNAAIRS